MLQEILHCVQKNLEFEKSCLEAQSTEKVLCKNDEIMVLFCTSLIFHNPQSEL